MRPLTHRQTQVLQLIISRIEASGMPPTRAEIAKSLGFKSANASEEHLKALDKKGYIKVMRGTSRGIQILKDEHDTPYEASHSDDAASSQPSLSIIGKVAAGQPILAVENVEDSVSIPPDFFQPPADFLLRVEGESMREIGIMDGDLLAVRKANTAVNGEIVVARVNDEVTVKRFERTSPRTVVLHAENVDFNPINVDLGADFFAIEGRAVGVLRR